jgi:hypothetical protein
MPTAHKPRVARSPRRPLTARTVKGKGKAPFDFMARLRADFPDGPPPGAPVSQLVAAGRGEV